MGLFDKDKESNDMKQASEIRDASNDNSAVHEANNLPAPNEAPATVNHGLSDDTNPFNTPIAGGGSVPGSSLPSQSQSGLLNEPSSNAMAEPNPLPSETSGSTASTLPSSSAALDGTANPFDTNSSIPTPSADSNLATNDPYGEAALFPMGNNDSAFSTKDSIQEMVDETVEKVIEERWVKLVEKVEKVANWKEKQDSHINMIKEDIVTIKDAFEKLEKRILNKIGDYDKNILDVNSEIKALEKVFQKITPTLVNNVNELSKIASDLKTDDSKK